MKYFVYILRNPSDKLYIGYTSYIPQRLDRHRLGEGAFFTNQHKNFKLVYQEVFDTALEAMRRERQVKGWSKAKKEALIAHDYVLLRMLSKNSNNHRFN